MNCERFAGVVLSMLIAVVGVSEEAIAQLADSPWPMQGGGPLHQGRANVVGPNKAEILWSVDLGSAESSPVLGADGNIYIGSGSGLMCISKSGAVLWNTVLGGKSYVTPAVAADGTIFTATMMDPGDLYAVNPDGTVKWMVDMHHNARVMSSPVIRPDGAVFYCACDAEGVYQLNPGDGSLMRHWTDMSAYYIASPALAPDGTLYVADDDYNLTALNTETGEKKWQYNVSGGFRSSPAIAKNETVYVGTDDGTVLAINPDGTRKWQFRASGSGAEFFSSPAIAPDGTIVIGCDNNSLYALNPDGTLKWEYQDPHWDVNGSPLIDAAGNIYVKGSSFFSLTPDGELRWDMGTGGYSIGQAMLDENGTLYVRTGNELLAIVPEPATLSLLAVGAIALIRRRRK